MDAVELLDEKFDVITMDLLCNSVGMKSDDLCRLLYIYLGPHFDTSSCYGVFILGAILGIMYADAVHTTTTKELVN